MNKRIFIQCKNPRKNWNIYPRGLRVFSERRMTEWKETIVHRKKIDKERDKILLRDEKLDKRRCVAWKIICLSLRAPSALAFIQIKTLIFQFSLKQKKSFSQFDEISPFYLNSVLMAFSVWKQIGIGLGRPVRAKTTVKMNIWNKQKELKAKEKNHKQKQLILEIKILLDLLEARGENCFMTLWGRWIWWKS